MKRIVLIIILLVAAIACNLTRAGSTGSPVPAVTTQPAPVVDIPTFTPTIYPANLIAYYPLTADLNDATGRNTPMLAQNAPLQPGGGLFSNGITSGDPAGSMISTPELSELDLSSFTISIQFNVPDHWDRSNPVFTGGDLYRWLIYKLKPNGSIQLIYNNSQAVDCTVTYQLNTWHEGIITYDGQTVVLYLDKVEGCRATAALETGDHRDILQTDYSMASTFYGTIRQLRVYNGVVNPAEIPFP